MCTDHGALESLAEKGKLQITWVLFCFPPSSGKVSVSDGGERSWKGERHTAPTALKQIQHSVMNCETFFTYTQVKTVSRQYIERHQKKKNVSGA